MKIGELARLTATRASTIRYYEQIDLLPAPKRIDGNHRRYDSADVERLAFIRRCRALGFSLEQVRQFARIAQSGGRATDHCREIVQTRLLSVRARIAAMRAVETRLAQLLADGAANAGSTNTPCARLAVLA